MIFSRPPVSKTSTIVAILTGTLLCACQFDATGTGDAEPEAEALDELDEDTAIELSLQYLEEDPMVLAGVDRLEVKRVSIDPRGVAHTRLAQMVGDVPVFGAEAIVHLSPDGSLRSVTDGLIRGVRINTTPLITAEAAVDIAAGGHGGWATVTDVRGSDLQILRYDGRTTLAYRVQLRQLEEGFDAAMPVVFIDAKTGDEVWEYDNLQTAALDEPGDKVTYDAHQGTDYDAATIADSSDSVANDAHVHAGLALAYFSGVHGRDSFDDSGAQVDSYVHFDRNYVNAFWDGLRLTYGDGSKKSSDPLVSFDVVTHELSHAVTDYTAGLIYANESGALNEATSDIFASAAEANQAGATFEDIWWIGEDIWKDDPNRFDDRAPALRYMDDPASAGDRDYWPTRYTGTSDGGGVHTNSGIANLWFHLLSVGGTHPRGTTSIDVPGIGIDAAEQIWYLALTQYMTPWTDYRDARTATLEAAADLEATYPGATQAVSDAWDAVGAPAAVDWHEASSQDVGTITEGSTATFTVTADATWEALRIMHTGTTGDADLYVAFDRTPTTSDYDCISGAWGSNEACTFETVQAGDYGVLVHAWTDGSGTIGDVTDGVLTVMYVGDPPQPPCTDNADCPDGDACTTDVCDNGTCVWTDVSCDDGNACTTDSCDSVTGACTSSDVPATYESPESSCAPSDGIDNDCDGATDCDDSDCSTATECQPEDCSNGVDDDIDGATDCADSECDGAPACTETLCEDTLDNDGDGATDCDDSDCAADPACAPPPPAGESVCDDGNDNDGNGATDCADTSCQTLLGDVCQGKNGSCNFDWQCINGKCRSNGPKAETCN